MYQYNLLPTQYQKRTRLWIIQRHVTNGFILINACLIIIIGILWSANRTFLFLIENIEKQSSTTVIDTSSTLAFAKNVQEVNNRITVLSEIQNKHSDHLRLLRDIGNVFPESTTISKMEIDYEIGLITVTGTVADRNALQSLQNTFDENETFSIDGFPFEAFTQSSNIPFTVGITFDPTEFIYE